MTKNWRKDAVTPEMAEAIGKPRSGERIGQYFLRWNRYCGEKSQRELEEKLRAQRGES